MSDGNNENERNMDPLWYKDAIIYQMHVKAFCDANGDGIGDFAGLAQRLDYIQELGVNTIWLQPFYPSPQRDDGYDISDYRDVHPDYGTLEDFRAFITEAHRRGLKVITELVINHTSDQHPWFQAARRAPPGSPEHEFYVWSDTDKKFAGTRIIFTDTETSNWAWDPIARRYYWHRFFSHQPDLNHNNPQVVDAVTDVMRFWLDMGVDGMRLDAIPYLCVAEGTNNENLPETHAVLKHMRAVVDAHYSGRMFLAEANQWPEDVREYFGEGDECHVAYHFPLMPRIFMAVALEDRYPIAEIMRQTPDIPENCQWAIFLRNHDELTLEMVTDRERDYMYRMYAQEPRMRVNVGIRRRLAPLLNNDIDRIKLMNTLLLSMPGSPIIYYGDEIGMGDNIYIGDRNGVRTPMQWSIDRNAGFSRADPQRLYLPLIMDPIYGYQAVNVEAQGRDPSSLLNWTRRILAVRRQHQSFGRGALEFIRPQNRKVIAYVRSFGAEVMLCVANLSQSAQAVELDLSRYKGRVPVEVLGRNAFPPIGELPYFLTLPAHGFFWLLLSETATPPAWHVERLPATELPVLVLTEGIRTLLANASEPALRSVARRTLHELEQEVLPEFMRQRGWFRAGASRKVQFGERIKWPGDQSDILLTFVYVEDAQGTRQRYSLPLTVAWEDGADTGVLRTADWTLAKVREHSKVGVLVDAFADPAFCVGSVNSIGVNARVNFNNGVLKFEPVDAGIVWNQEDLLPLRYLSSEQPHTSVVLGERVLLKAYRRAEAGINPDIEMTRFLMLKRFKHILALAGTVVCEWAGSLPITLAATFEFVGNQGDAWTYAMDHLDRLASDLRTSAAGNGKSPNTLFNARMHTMGRRVGELHGTLCDDSSDPAFAVEPINDADLVAWNERITQLADRTFTVLEERAATWKEAAPANVHRLLDSRERIRERTRLLMKKRVDAVRTRHHGNLQLRSIQLVADDFLLTDFDGDPALPLDERRRKHSPLRDVATILRSFDHVQAVAFERVNSATPDLSARLTTAFAEWREGAVDAFLKGYRRGVGDARSIPVAAGDFDRLIELFRIEHALRDLHEALIYPAAAGIAAPIDALLVLSR
ncbi:MAG TPA: maltose alpha-D-glucosyltransferase [Steroidobacteraceae bacterium]